MWIQAVRTMIAPRRICEEWVPRSWSWGIWWMASIKGIFAFLFLGKSYDGVARFGGMENFLIATVLCGPLLGQALLNIVSLLLYALCRILRLVCSFAAIRVCLLISWLPLILAGIVDRLVRIGLRGVENLVIPIDFDSLPAEEKALQHQWFTWVTVLDWIFAIWSFILLIKCLVQVTGNRRGRMAVIAVLFGLVQLFPILPVQLSILISWCIWMLIVLGVFLAGFMMLISFLHNGSFPRWLTALMNRGLVSTAPEAVADEGFYNPVGILLQFPFAWHVGVLCAVLFPLVFLRDVHRITESEFAQLKIFCTSIAVAALIVAFAQMMKVKHNRQFKYDLGFAGWILLYAVLVSSFLRAEAIRTNTAVMHQPAGLIALMIYLVFPLCVVSVGSIAIGVCVALLEHQRKTPTRTCRWLYMGSRSVVGLTGVYYGLVTLTEYSATLGFQQWLFVGFCLAVLVRFWVFLWMMRSPIVFLRSFHDPESTVGFGKIIMGVAIFKAPVVALTYVPDSEKERFRSQSPSELLAYMTPDAQARLFTSTHDTWRDWVIDHLSRCTAVIFEWTMESGGVVWEMEQALHLVPTPNIILLIREGQDTRPVPEGVQVIRYRLDRQGIKKARRELKAALRLLVIRPEPPPATQPVG